MAVLSIEDLKSGENRFCTKIQSVHKKLCADLSTSFSHILLLKDFSKKFYQAYPPWQCFVSARAFI